MTKSEQLLARRSFHSKDLLHFLFSFFPSTLSSWTLNFPSGQEIRIINTLKWYFLLSHSFAKKRVLTTSMVRKRSIYKLPLALFGISSFLHPFRAELTNAPTWRHRWNSEILAIKKPGSWSKRGHEKSHLAGKRPWIREVKQLNI